MDQGKVGAKMKVKMNNAFFGEGVFSAEITANGDSFCDESPMLIVAGKFVCAQEATLAEYQYLETTDAELGMLKKAGYLW